MQDEATMGRAAYPQADDPSRVDVDFKGDVDEDLPSHTAFGLGALNYRFIRSRDRRGTGY